MQVRVMELSNIPNTKEQCIRNYDEFVWGTDDHQRFFTTLSHRSDLHCFILCTDWCPDVIWNAPVLFRVMEESGIPTEVLIMEEHLDTMDHFLVDGGRPQPIAVFLSENGDVMAKWGARPAYIQAVMDEFRMTHPDRQSSEYQEAIQDIYREIGQLYHDGTKYQDAMIQELRELFTAHIS